MRKGITKCNSVQSGTNTAKLINIMRSCRGILSNFGVVQNCPNNKLKPENNSFQLQKSTYEIQINRTGTRMIKDGEN